MGSAATLGAIFGITIALAELHYALAEEAESLVVNLTDSNFQDLVKRGDDRPWVVKFYAPWCGHCKMIAPTWESLAKKVQGQVNVGKVDCTESQYLSNMFDVRGFPTLKLISKGRVYGFSGRRSLENLEPWALQGHQGQEGDMYPFDRPLYHRATISVATLLAKYGLQIIAVALIAVGALVCHMERQQSQRQRRQEDQLKELAQRRAAESEGSEAHEEVASKKDD
ncbi:unnamed protein product [Symbiodinium microadriaticum]|nr:unnamed protein product [Symbiodinium microadriaticum]CAE7836305.1 unnamed protein product [Symbiodinium sp. KB8]